MTTTAHHRHTSFEETLLSARRTMLMSEILKLAMDSFRAAKTRFVLTALGMVIGTASVILVVTIGMTGRQYVLQLIQKFGTNSVEVEYAGGGATNAERVRYTDFLTREDEKAVDAQLPGVMYSSPVMDMHDRISFGGGVVKDTLVLGVSPQYLLIHNLIVTAGRFFDDTDEDNPPEVRRGQRTLCQGALWQFRRLHWPHLRDQRHSLHRHRRLQDERQRLRPVRNRRPDHPHSLFRGPLLYRNRAREPDLLLHAQHGRWCPTAQKEILRIIKSRHRTNSVYKAQTLKELLDMAQ